MKQPKLSECPHRITSFQAHSGCQLLAAICEKQCQQLHNSSNEVVFSSIDLIEQDFKILRERYRLETYRCLERIKQYFREANQYLQKQQMNFLKDIEMDLKNQFYRSISLDKETVEKIQNKRFQRIKCNELFIFLESKNIDEQLRKSNLPALIDKYTQIASQIKCFILQADPLLSHPRSTQTPNTLPLPATSFTQQSTRGVQNVTPSVVNVESEKMRYSSQILYLQQKNRNMQRINQILAYDLQRSKYENKKLHVIVSNLRRDLSKKDILKGGKSSTKLSLKTWSILKVVTKKIKKPKKPIVVPQKENGLQKESHLENKIVMDNVAKNSQFVLKQPQNNMSDRQHSPLSMDIEGIDLNEAFKHRHQAIAICSSQEQVAPKKTIEALVQSDKKVNSNKEKPVQLDQQPLKGPLAIIEVGNSRQPSEKGMSDSEQQQSDFFSFFQRKLF